MRKALLIMGLFCVCSFADEVSAYKAGWTDGFRTAYNLKGAKRVEIPAGYWLYLPADGMPIEVLGFYVFSAQRLGMSSYFTDREVIFGVFQRLADAEFYKQQLEGKGIEGLRIEKREGTFGYEGDITVLGKAGENLVGVSGVYYHLSKAIERAKEIDPTVLNRDLLVKDLESILAEIEKWRSGGKGYERKVEERKQGEAEVIKKFLGDKQ